MLGEGTRKCFDSPSIGHIQAESAYKMNKKDVQDLFTKRMIPKFTIEQLTGNEKFNNYGKYKALVSALENWNQRIDKQSYDVNIRSEFARNQYIYTTLKNLACVKFDCFQTILNRLFDWYKQNSSDTPSVFFQMKKKKIKEDDWIVRETYRSNMPLDINNYQRKVFDFSETLKGKENQDTKRKKSEKKDFFAVKFWEKYKLQEKSLRNKEEEIELERFRTSWKLKRNRFGEQTTKNFHKGTFSHNKKWISATTTPEHTLYEPIKTLRIKTSLGQRCLNSLSKSNSVRLVGIDGSQLMTNPFETKSKLKKKPKKFMKN